MAGTPSAQYSLTLRVEVDDIPGMLGQVAGAIGAAGATIGAVDLVRVTEGRMVRDFTVLTSGSGDWPVLRDAVNAVPGARVLDLADRTFLMHLGGKIEMRNKSPLRSRDDLSMAYTPGVARVCTAIFEDPEKAFQYTMKRNTVAVVSDGTAVLGLGDIGPRAAMPVMEGKAMLFKEFAGVDAVPICLDTRDPDEIVGVVKAIAPGFGGINLEDISAPRCFEIEDRLKAELDIPVFHDDQHGTAVVVLAAVYNALALTGRSVSNLRVLIVGLGAAGIAVARILLSAGVPGAGIIGCDSRGAVHVERADYLDGSMHPVKRWLAETTNIERRSGGPADVIDGCDLFLGLSGASVMPASALGRMAPEPIVFAMANPDPEISPEEAAPFVRVLATGRSDYPNQINNVLAFPGMFRGALDVRAPQITEPMKTAAARAIASIVGES
ncbi:MAG TPA: NAD-dependent malic enzyme, partial [Solirubrobacteraceae bacterium]|nr:NAD-dependent malic enzyme [Solirubrobacteraceae bacterium]